jgi:hypothetical protein
MLEDLFITNTPGEASSSGIELSNSIDNWPMEIQNIIANQIPMIMSNPGQLNFDSVDQDKLYAKGAYAIPVGGGEETITIPIVVKAGELLPMDLYIYKGEWHPMDMNDISAIMTSPEIGTNLISDDDMPNSSDSGFISRVTPPGGYGSGVISSLASKMSNKSAAIRDKVIETIQGDPQLQRKLTVNKVAKDRFLSILDGEPTSKAASAEMYKVLFTGDRVIFSLGNGKFSIKSAALHSDHIVGMGHIECDGDQLVTGLKEAGLDCVRIISDLKTNKMAFTWDDNSKKETEIHVQVTKSGSYTGYRDDLTPVDVDVMGIIKTALDESRYLVMHSNGDYSLQRELIGKPSTKKVDKTASLKSPSRLRAGDTMTIPAKVTEGTGIVEFTAPTKVSSVVHTKHANKAHTVINGTSCMGKIAYIFTSDENVKVPVATKFYPEGLMIEKGASVWFVPETYPVISLKGNPVPMLKNAADLRSSICIRGDSKTPVTTARIWNIDSGNVGIKIGSASPAVYPKTIAMLLIRQSEGSGVLESMAKIAAGEIKVIDLVKGGTGKSDYLASRVKKLGLNEEPKATDNAKVSTVNMKSALKVAAALEDSEAVDTVLSLNYLTPENLSEFKIALPELKSAREILSKLLMSVRLGFTIAEEQDVKNVLTTLHSVIKSIETSM